MARPRKQTVDYFPHDTDASESRTLTILEHKFGNDGYACWFKLLELMGRTRGHYFIYNDADSLEFLSAKTKIKNTETLLDILTTLATRGAIDKELHDHKIIWSQNFVNGIADVYGRRKEPLPLKPDWRVIEGLKEIIVDGNPVNDSRSTQSKVNESKVNESKRKDNDNDNSDQPISDNSNSEADIFGLFEREIGGLSPVIDGELRAALGRYPTEWIVEAIKEAARAGDKKRNLRYIAGILENWRRDGRAKTPEGESLLKIPGDFEQDPVADVIWIKALGELEKQVTKTFYRTFLEGSRAVGYKDNVFTLAAPNYFVAEYLSGSQHSLIENAVIGFTQPGIKVVFGVLQKEVMRNG